MKRWQWWVAAAILVAGCQSIDVAQEGGFRVSQALSQNQPPPVLSHDYGKAFTVDKAYQIQRLAVEQTLRGRQPLGFKGGLTSPEAQQQFSTNQPIAGVLLADAEIPSTEDGYQFLQKSFRKGIIETELGFRLTQRVNAQVPDIATLKKLVAEIAPVIELPDLAMAGDKPTALDLIATNVGAKRVIIGPGRAPSLTDPNAIHIDLYREGEPLNNADSRTVQGDQWQALLWLVNRTVASGWAIEPRQWLITGSIGKAAPLQRGLYVADYGRFARLEFIVE